MADRYFTPAEVEALIPTLTRLIEPLMRAHREASGIQEALQEERRQIAMAGGAVVDQAAWRARVERLERLTEEIRGGLERISALGGVTKDLDMGLVDFAHRRAGRTVNLCWRYGEERVTHWHGLDEGYAARKPL
ncbi:MAG TPA: DUF2203 domain-containing protein [Candidatus Tectomicrobia bacterium]|nr:DUF2203 domain-containing protein [Candidatus Tectomicrobia bacterium]